MMVLDNTSNAPHERAEGERVQLSFTIPIILYAESREKVIKITEESTGVSLSEESSQDPEKRV